MFKKKVKVDTELWEKVKDDFETEDDELILERVFHIYFKGKYAIQKNAALKRELSETKKTLREKRTELNRVYKEHRKMTMEYNKIVRKHEGLKKRFNKNLESLKALRSQKAIVKKEVVYKEDISKIEDIRVKNEEQKQKLWKLRFDLEKAQLWKDKYNELITVVDNWKRDNMAVLVKGGLNLNSENVDVEILDSKTYYQFKLDPKDFINKNNIISYLLKEISY